MKTILYPFLVTSLVILITFGLFEGLETYFPQQLRALGDHSESYAFISFLILSGDILLPVPSSIVMYLNGLVLGPIWGNAALLYSLIGRSDRRVSDREIQLTTNE